MDVTHTFLCLNGIYSSVHLIHLLPTDQPTVLTITVIIEINTYNNNTNVLSLQVKILID